MKKILMFSLAVMLSAPSSIRTAAAGAFQIAVLSSRPDMVTGGDALISIQGVQGEALDTVAVTLNGKNVTPAFRTDTTSHALIGLLAGLKIGENSLNVFDGANHTQPAATLTLKNHPATGPVFSGPQEQPFVCQTQEFKLPDGKTLGAPLDANCSVKTVVTYVYKSTSAPPPATTGRGSAAAAFLPLPAIRHSLAMSR